MFWLPWINARLIFRRRKKDIFLLREETCCLVNTEKRAQNEIEYMHFQNNNVVAPRQKTHVVASRGTREIMQTTNSQIIRGVGRYKYGVKNVLIKSLYDTI